MANAKRKCTFTNEMQKKHSCFRKGRSDYEANCLICKSGTFIYVVYKSNGDLNTHLQSQIHRKAVRGAVTSPKMTNYFVTARSKREDKITAQKALLPFTLLSIIIAFCPWTVHRFYLKEFFLILM